MIRFLLFAGLRSKRILLTALLLAAFHLTRAQELKLGSNPTVINKAAILELESTTRGLLLPRIPDTTVAPLTSAPDGMMIYFTVDSSLYVRKGGAWQKVVDKKYLMNNASSYWQYGGNAVTAAQNLGTTSAFDLPVITNNTERMRVASNGKVGIGTATPSDTLTVAGSFRLGRSGTGMTAIIRYQQAVPGTAITSGGGSYDYSFPLTGVIPGATVMASPLTVLPAGIIVAYAYASAANTVTIRLTNTNVFTSSLTILGISLLGVANGTTTVNTTTFAITVMQ